MEKIRVAVIGAGGKMGTRTSRNLAKMTDKYDLMLVENAPAGIESIRGRGLDVTPMETALERAQVIVFAVPDTLIKKLSAAYVPMLQPGTGFLILDPAPTDSAATAASRTSLSAKSAAATKPSR